MAVSNISSTETILPLSLLRGEIQSDVAQTKIQEYPLLNAVRKQSAFQQSIDWPANFGTANTYGRATSATPSANSDTDTNEQAVLPIGSRVIEHKFSIDLTQATQAARIAPNGTALRNLYRAKAEAGLDALMKQLEILAYTGDGLNASHGIVGLDKAIANIVTGPPATDIYAGIDGNVLTGWKAYNNTNGSARALTTALLRATSSGQGKLGGTYNLIMTTYDVTDTMESLFESRLAVNQVNGTTDLGFTGLAYQGRPVYKSVYCPDKTVYFLNTKDIILHTVALQPAINMMAGGESEVVNYNGLNILLTRMPQVNPHSVDFLMSIQAQMQVFNRRSAARLHNVQ